MQERPRAIPVNGEYFLVMLPNTPAAFPELSLQEFNHMQATLDAIEESAKSLQNNILHRDSATPTYAFHKEDIDSQIEDAVEYLHSMAVSFAESYHQVVEMARQEIERGAAIPLGPHCKITREKMLALRRQR